MKKHLQLMTGKGSLSRDRKEASGVGDATSDTVNPQWASSTQTKTITSLRLTHLLSECGWHRLGYSKAAHCVLFNIH